MKVHRMWVLGFLVFLGFTSDLWAQKKGRDVPVCATFRDAADDKVRSDNSGSYCHGIQGVSAVIGGVRGSFHMDTTGSSQRVIVNFPDCSRLIPIDSLGNCSTSVVILTLNEQKLSEDGTFFVSTGEKLNLQQMEVGSTRYVDFQIAFPSSSKSTPHLVVWGASNFGPSGACGDPLPIARTSPSSWTITVSTEEACLHEVDGKRHLTQTGMVLPFEITIEK